MVRVELKLTLEGGHVLTMDLISDGPEDTFPDQARLGISDPQIVLIVDGLTRTAKVEICRVEPVTDDEKGSDRRPDLEPTFRVDIVEGEV